MQKQNSIDIFSSFAFRLNNFEWFFVREEKKTK
jgi:hypothetical protein